MYNLDNGSYQLALREHGLLDSARKRKEAESVVPVPRMNSSSGMLYLDAALQTGARSTQMLRAGWDYLKQADYESASDVLQQVMYDTKDIHPKMYAASAVLFQLSSNLEELTDGLLSYDEFSSRVSEGVWDQIEFNSTWRVLDRKESVALVELVRNTLENFEASKFHHVDI